MNPSESSTFYRSRTRVIFALCLSFLMILLLTTDASACSVCFNGKDAAATQSLNGAIFMMLGFIGVVLGGVGWFAFSLIQRAKNPLPDHLVFADSISES